MHLPLGMVEEGGQPQGILTFVIQKVNARVRLTVIRKLVLYQNQSIQAQLWY